MRSFSGFPSGKTPVVRLPQLVFEEIVPTIDDLAELKVTLHVLWRLSQLPGAVSYVPRSELESDSTLLAGLGDSPRETIEDALRRSRARGVLLEAMDTSGERMIFANSPKGRAAVAALKRGEWPGELESATRPNIFTLYEQNIGVLTPLIADELRDAETTYPAHWIEAAFREAVSLNKRSWRYILAILERWRVDGRGEGESGPPVQARRRYIEGEYGDYIDH